MTSDILTLVKSKNDCSHGSNLNSEHESSSKDLWKRTKKLEKRLRKRNHHRSRRGTAHSDSKVRGIWMAAVLVVKVTPKRHVVPAVAPVERFSRRR